MKKFRGESPNWRRRRVPTSMPQSTICLANSSRSLRVAASEKVGFISQRTLTQPIMQKFQQHKYSYFLRESKNILKILSSFYSIVTILNSTLGLSLSINFSATTLTHKLSFLIVFVFCRQSSCIFKLLSRSGLILG